VFIVPIFNSHGTNHQTVNERLPTELGWSIPTTVISLEDLHNFSADVINATSFDALEIKK
jgi:hypothetical protein